MNTNTNDREGNTDAVSEAAEESFELLLPSLMRQWEEQCVPDGLSSTQHMRERQAFLSGAVACQMAFDRAIEADSRVTGDDTPAFNAVSASLSVMCRAVIEDSLAMAVKELFAGESDEGGVVAGKAELASVVIRMRKDDRDKLTNADAKELADLIDGFVKSRIAAPVPAPAQND